MEMELTEFTAGACGSGQVWFVAPIESYKDTQSFLNACFYEFDLTYEKPNEDIIYKGYARAFDNYNEENGSPMDMEDGFCFCDKDEEGAFEVYIFDTAKAE